MFTRVFPVLALLIAALVCLTAVRPAAAEDAATEPAAASSSAEAQPDLYVAIMELQLSHDDLTPEQMTALAGHIGHLKELYDAGTLLLAGPFDDESGQGMSVMRGKSREEVQAACESDPSVKAGLMKIIAVHPWWDAFNAWEGRSLTMEEFIELMSAPPAAAEGAAAASH